MNPKNYFLRNLLGLRSGNWGLWHCLLLFASWYNSRNHKFTCECIEESEGDTPLNCYFIWLIWLPYVVFWLLNEEENKEGVIESSTTKLKKKLTAEQHNCQAPRFVERFLYSFFTDFLFFCLQLIDLFLRLLIWTFLVQLFHSFPFLLSTLIYLFFRLLISLLTSDLRISSLMNRSNSI